MIDTDELQQELDKTQVAFKKWAAATTRVANDCKASFLRTIRTTSADVESLNERYYKLERQAAEVQQCMARDVAERDALRGMAESLGGEKAALQRRLWQLRAELESETAAAQAAEQELQRERGAQDHQLAALDKLQRLYATVLGLELVPDAEAEAMSVVFKLVDPRDPARPFKFSVRVQKDDSYELISCEPPLDCLDELAPYLRQQGTFGQFAKGARRGFVALVKREMEGAQA